jgi:hypothetical protein
VWFSATFGVDARLITEEVRKRMSSRITALAELITWWEIDYLIV